MASRQYGRGLPALQFQDFGQRVAQKRLDIVEQRVYLCQAPPRIIGVHQRIVGWHAEGF